MELRVSALEADLAYFEARLELLGEPISSHQKAQKRVYEALEVSLKKAISQLQHSSGPRLWEPF